MKNQITYRFWGLLLLSVSLISVGCGQQAQLVARLDDQQAQIAELNRQLSDAHVRIEELNNRLYLTQDQLEALRTQQGVRTKAPQSLKRVRLVPEKQVEKPQVKPQQAEVVRQPEPQSEPVVISNWDKKQKQPRAESDISVSPGKLVQDYRNALALYRQKRYNEALEAFADFQRKYKKNEYTDNAIFWSGVSFFEMGEWNLALTEFRKLGPQSGSNKQADALYYIGQCYLKQGNEDKAKETWRELKTRHPKSEAAKRCER